MAKKKIEGLGDQAVSKFLNNRPRRKPLEVPKSNVGRPKTIYREMKRAAKKV